jgi:type VI secretion system protein ImpL
MNPPAMPINATSIPDSSGVISFISEQLPSLSSMTLTLFVLGIIVIITAILLISYSLNNKSIKIGDKKPQKKTFSVPPIGGAITRYLIDNGWISVNSLSQLFLKGLEFIKSKLGENAIYRLPWYIVVGTKESGKSTLCNQMPLMRPFGEMNFALHEASPLIKWHLFTKAVVIDVAGRIFLNNPLLETDSNSFRNLLILLAKYRVSKPLNGIILCISAKELYGKDKLSSDELQSRADALLNNMVNIQSGLRLRLPVYIMITNCDAIAGFNALAQELPKKNRDSIFGWSAPYNLQHAFSPVWLEEAFGYLNESLEELQLELLACTATERNNVQSDGVFVFAKEFISMEQHLSTYLNRIFHSSSTHDSPILRGIYFTGNTDLHPLQNIDQSNSDMQLNAHSNHPVSLAFLKNLFDLKIFPETGIAKPLEGAIKSLNRGLNIIRNSTVGFVLIATYGLFNAYDSFSEKKERILPVLGKMNSLLRSMQHLKIDEPGHTGALFDTYARQLLEMMHELQQTNFFSPLVPASWFSPLHKDLHAGLQIAYQEIVIKTIYVDLLLKARALLQMRPTAQDRSNSLGALLNPLNCSEYLILKKFVEGLETLNDMLFKFNNLKSAPDSKDLDSLISYTFESHLPAQFVQEYDSFKKVLHESSFPLIDLKPYEQMARQTLSVLYENFLNAMFSNNDVLTLPSRLQTLIDSLQSQEKRQSIDIESLRNAVGDLNDTAASLGEVGATWMDGKVFFPGKEFDQLLDKIEMSPLFDKDVTQYLVDQTAIGFARFKHLLTDLNNSLVDTPSQKTLPPSHGILLIEKHLASFFKRPFMSKPDGKPFTSIIPNNKLLYWDANLIQFAFNTVKDYDSFMTKDLLEFPLSIQENIKVSGRINLQKTLISTLGKAQTFIDIPKDTAISSTAERMLRAQVNDLKNVSDQFAKLLEVLKQDDVSKAYMELRNVLCSQAQWLLRQIDIYLDHLKLYKMKHDDFSWWEGKHAASLGAFAVRDNDELKHYLTIQRQILLSAVNDFAKPIVELLKNTAFDSAEGRDETLISKWIRLNDEVEAYGKKQPNNSLALLENFLQKDMDSWDYKEVIKNISLTDVKKTSGDYLLDTMRSIKLKLLARAEVLQRNQAITNYQNLVAQFDKNLKDKFPFVGNNLEENKGEVNPADLKRFFEFFKKYGDSAKAILDQIYQLGTFTKENAEFLKSLEEVKEFFETFLNDKSAETPSFNLKIDFRKARDKEKGGNLIVDWYVKTDEMTTINKHDKKNDGSWTYGQPFTVGFKWPEGGDSNIVQPENDNEQSALKIDKETAEFVYQNQWSLLWLLRTQAAPAGSYSKKDNPTPYILKFSIPLSDQTYAVVYNSISITKPGKDKSPPKVVKTPVFPTSAPELPDRVIELKDKSVLTEGSIKEITFDDLIKSSSDEEEDEDDSKEDSEKKDKKKKEDSEQ